MDRYRIIETTEEVHIRVSASPEEIAIIAAAMPKVIAALNGSYQPDIHIHQALQAAAEVSANRIRALTGRN